MKAVFIGSSHFGLRSLELLRNLDCCDVAGVVTAPKEFTISYQPEGVTNVLHADVSKFCLEHDLRCVVLRRKMNDDSLIEKVRQWRPDIFLVVGWYHIVPKRWRDLAPAYGLHASLLPDYSGGAPLVWAMINGGNQTGITLFQFDGGVDSGPILAQATTGIDEADNIATLYSRIEKLGLSLIEHQLPLLANGTAKLTPQENSKRRVFPQRKPEDDRIDWTQRSEDLHNFVRAQTRPYPGAFTALGKSLISVWKTSLSCRAESRNLKCGEVAQTQDALIIGTGKGHLEILETTFEGREVTGLQLRAMLAAGTILGIE